MSNDPSAALDCALCHGTGTVRCLAIASLYDGQRRDARETPCLCARVIELERQVAGIDARVTNARMDGERSALARAHALDPAAPVPDLDALEAAWADAAPGPWRAGQWDGLGAMRFVVSADPYHKLVAILENPGAFAADQAIASCRTAVPWMIRRVRDIEAALRELGEAADPIVRRYGASLPSPEYRLYQAREAAVRLLDDHPARPASGDGRG